MAGKVASVPFGPPGKAMGTFHAETFDMDVEEDCSKYASLRTKANDRGSGIVIDRIKELTKTEITVISEDRSRTETREDHYCLFVEWWERVVAPARSSGDNAPKEWSHEGTVPVAQANPNNSSEPGSN